MIDWFIKNKIISNKITYDTEQNNKNKKIRKW